MCLLSFFLSLILSSAEYGHQTHAANLYSSNLQNTAACPTDNTRVFTPEQHKSDSHTSPSCKWTCWHLRGFFFSCKILHTILWCTNRDNGKWIVSEIWNEPWYFSSLKRCGLIHEDKKHTITRPNGSMFQRRWSDGELQYDVCLWEDADTVASRVQN